MLFAEYVDEATKDENEHTRNIKRQMIHENQPWHIRMAMNAWAHPDGEKVPTGRLPKRILNWE